MAATDARPIPIKNTAFRAVFPILDADGDLVTGATGLDSEVSKDQGTFADCTNEATEIATSSGMYYLDLTATEMNADCVAVIVKTSSSGAKTTVLVFYPEETGDINVDVSAWLGTAAATPTVAGVPEVDLTHVAGSTTSVSTLASSVATLLADIGGVATAAADGDPTSTDLLFAYIKQLVNVLTGTAGIVTFPASATPGNAVSMAEVLRQIYDEVAGVNGITPAAVADIPTAAANAAAVWDLDATAHQTQGTFGQAIGDPAADTNTIFKATVTDATGATVGVDVVAALAAIDAVDNYVDTEIATLTTELAKVPKSDSTVSWNATALADIQTQVEDGIEAKLILRRNTAQAGAAGTITLDASASATNDLYNGLVVAIVSGTGAGQARQVTDYVGATKVANVTPNWITNPFSDSVFVLLPAGLDQSIYERIGAPAGASVSADILAIDDYVDTEVAAIKAKTDQLTFTTANQVDAQVLSMAANVLTAAATAADFGTEVATAVWASATRTLSALGFTLGASDLAADTIGASELAADAITEIVNAVLTTAMTESYNADGAAPTLAQAMFVTMQRLTEFAISGTTISVKGLDGTTTKYTLTLDDATSPTSTTRAT